jgi:hypothetical protein
MCDMLMTPPHLRTRLHIRSYGEPDMPALIQDNNLFGIHRMIGLLRLRFAQTGIMCKVKPQQMSQVNRQ